MKVAGVCRGLADSFDVDPLLVRIIMVAATLGGGVRSVFLSHRVDSRTR